MKRGIATVEVGFSLPGGVGDYEDAVPLADDLLQHHRLPLLLLPLGRVQGQDLLGLGQDIPDSSRSLELELVRFKHDMNSTTGSIIIKCTGSNFVTTMLAMMRLDSIGLGIQI